MLKIKGHMRRRRYQCRECLNEVMEYPGNVLDAFALVCPDCQRKRDLMEDLRLIRVGDSVIASSESSSLVAVVIEGKGNNILCDTGILFSKETGVSINLPVPLTIEAVQRKDEVNV